MDERVRDLVEECVRRHGAQAIDVVLRGDAANRVLQVFADAPDGMTIDRCSQISRTITAAIDGGGLLRAGYRLEVSSPGIDRPLKYAWQYPKHRGRTLRVTFDGPEGRAVHVGVLEAVEDDAIVVATSPSGQVRVAFDRIREAKVLPPW